MKKIVGVFGGSFDPPHVGHYQLVQAALQVLPLDEVWVIPVGIPVHRRLSGVADGLQRVAWLNAMFADEERVSVVEWEVAQHRPVPTIETLRRIHQEHVDVLPVWLTGADAFAGLPSWVEYPQHRDLCSIAVFDRAGFIEPHIPNQWQRGGIEQVGHVMFVGVELANVSASDVREKIKQGESLAGLVCESVREEIEALYGSARSKGGGYK